MKFSCLLTLSAFGLASSLTVSIDDKCFQLVVQTLCSRHYARRLQTCLEDVTKQDLDVTEKDGNAFICLGPTTKKCVPASYCSKGEKVYI